MNIFCDIKTRGSFQFLPLSLGNGLTLGVGGARAGQRHPKLGARPLRGGVMGVAVACGGMVKEKDQKRRCEEEEQVGSHQCPQDVLAALLTTGPNTRRVPAGGGGGGGR